MKKVILLTSIVLLAGLSSSFAAIHQSASGTQAYSDSANAVEKGKAETQEFDGKTCTRVTAEMSQWGFVTYWMGIPTPAGAATVRVRLYNSGEPTAKYSVYVAGKDGHKGIGELALPADAPADSFVDVDLSVNSETPWSGIVLKKMDNSEKPSVWIESVNVLLN